MLKPNQRVRVQGALNQAAQFNGLDGTIEKTEPRVLTVGVEYWVKLDNGTLTTFFESELMTFLLS